MILNNSQQTIYTQRQYFYNKPWTKQLDEALLDILNREKKAYFGKFTAMPHQALMIVMTELNNNHRLELEMDDLISRFTILKKGYETFKWLFSKLECSWDMMGNWVSATEENWITIFQCNSLAKTYYRDGEPLFRQLSVVFGHNTVKDEKIDEEKEFSPDGASDSEEVTSPPSNSRRRLFDEAARPSDGILKHCVLPCPRGYTSKEPAPPYVQSSCSSSSPLMWWKP